MRSSVLIFLLVPKPLKGLRAKWNTAVDGLAKTQDAKGERYIFHQVVEGHTAAQALAENCPASSPAYSWPKSMSWPGSQGVRFIRPIRWIVALLDDQAVPFEVAGVRSGNTTRGHRILGAKEPLPVTIASYEQVLRDNFVLVKSEERRLRIEERLEAGVHRDAELLESLVNLTEFPSVIRGSFDPSFLELPKEILSTVMRHHQRYFSVVDEDGALRPEFCAVTNTDGDPDDLIRQGNERVLRARFNDARFFWRADQRKPLAERLPDLAKVTFQAKLGSYEDKTKRVVDLAGELANHVSADGAVVKRAGLLAKCDLTTDMVKEFTELQGAVGGLYARAQGENEHVAIAIYDHYKPVSMEDPIPRTLEGQVVSVADKLDTLRECFRIGLVPTGSKDPFALRRAAQGIVKILFEAKLALPLAELTKNVPGLLEFFKERIEYYLRYVVRYGYDEVAAVLATDLTTLADVAERVEAIHHIRPTPDFEPVAAAFKRIKNILKQAQVSSYDELKADLLAQGPERDLYNALTEIRAANRKARTYSQKLEAMASLRPHVDVFFDKILVNDPDPAIRQNRLALLSSLLTEFSNIADFSEIVTQGNSGVAAQST